MTDMILSQKVQKFKCPSMTRKWLQFPFSAAFAILLCGWSLVTYVKCQQLKRRYLLSLYIKFSHIVASTSQRPVQHIFSGLILSLWEFFILLEYVITH